mgnify:CR=1 FL=1
MVLELQAKALEWTRQRVVVFAVDSKPCSLISDVWDVVYSVFVGVLAILIAPVVAFEKVVPCVHDGRVAWLFSVFDGVVDEVVVEDFVIAGI